MEVATTSPTSPPRKQQRSAAFGSPKSDRVDDIADKLDDIVHQCEDEAKSVAESPESVESDIAFIESIAEDLRALVSRIKLQNAETRHESATRDVGHAMDVAPEDVLLVDKGKSIDALQLKGCYDDPDNWPKNLKRAYKEHYEHNIRAVREALGEGVVSTRQVRDYFSLEGDVICVLDYPPEGQVGRLANLAFILSEKHTEENGLCVMQVLSACIRQHVLAFTKASGKHHDKYELMEMISENGYTRYVALNAHARDSLRFDYVERHPTFIANDVKPDKLISKSSLGRRHVEQGDAIFARFIKARQEYVRERNKGKGQDEKRAPVFVWNAGLSRSGDERTGALAALFASLEQAGVEEIQGIHHPCFIFRTENPLVQISAASYDMAVCEACRASGREIVDETFWQRFIGVADMTPEERLVKERESREFYNALGTLAWMSTGKPGSNKRAVFEEFLAADIGEEQAKHMAQAKVLFDGAVQAAARRLGMSEEVLESLSLEDRQVLQRAMAAADLARGQLQAAAIWAGNTQAELEAMTKMGKQKLLGRYLFDCQLQAAAKWDSVVDVSKLSDEAKKQLVAKYEHDCTVRAAAIWAKTSDEELAGLSDEAKTQLVAKYKFDCKVRIAASWANMSDEELAGLSDEAKKQLVTKYLHDCKVRIAASWANMSDEELEGLSDEAKKQLVAKYEHDCTVRAAAIWANTSDKELAGLSDEAKTQLLNKYRTEFVEPRRHEAVVASAAQWAEMEPEELSELTREETTSLLGRFFMDRKAIAACASLGISEDDLVDMPRERVAEIVRKHSFKGKLKSALRWKNKSQADGDSMSQKEREDLVEEHKRSSMLASACEALGENFQTASTEWTDAQRGELIDVYKLLRRCEELGYSKEEARQLSAEERKQVKRAYNKRLLLRRLDIVPPEAGDDDAANLEYEAGMAMSLDELWTMIVMRDGGMTPEQSIRYTSALNLGLSKEQIESLSDEDLDRARVHRLQRGIQKRNERRGLFHVPGTPDHAEVVKTIQSYLKAAGVGILTELPDAANFANGWAFRKFVDPNRTNIPYNIYRQETFHGIPVWVSLMEDMLRTLGRTGRRARQTPCLTVAAISDYVYRLRVDLFSDRLASGALERLTPGALERLAPRVPFSSQPIAERAKLQRRIENRDPEFKFPGDAVFNQVLGQLEADESATFQMGGKWESRICLQRVRSIRPDTGRERFTDCLYYLDDTGAWNGPNVDWGLLDKERAKKSVVANVEILNEIDSRLRTRPAFLRELIAFDEEWEETIFIYDDE